MLSTQGRQKHSLCWAPFHLQLQELGGGGGIRRRFSFPAPLGVLSCEVSGSDCSSQHHCEILHQELAAQRCFHGGELPGARLMGQCGQGNLSLQLLQPLRPSPLPPQIPVMVYLDPAAVAAEGVPWWVILLAVLAGLLVLALLVLLMWKVRLGEGGATGGGALLSGCGVALVPTVPFIQQICVEHLPTCANISIRPWMFRG